ncbi:hypothetical protein [Saccharothrix variisporea]|uniref:Uncharacterized protein n=1 Tax=Saccharothrix variisporea TaxID=543527 RepID=A0A495X9W3_9PSEU|nr:hypothetical protein [Saccharothrix variisporea]RKT69875.1 hypothetical protein DFJ66_3113 [Saccharothrix variisporea]
MLPTWIREVGQEPLLLDPGAPLAEARENTWSLSVSAAERRSLTVQEVVTAFEDCVTSLRRRVRALGHGGSVSFYVWHDQQAGQLRCSTTTSPRDRLPFGARVDLEASLAAIVEEFLADRGAEASADPEPGDAEFVVPVWVVEVGAPVVH